MTCIHVQPNTLHATSSAAGDRSSLKHVLASERRLLGSPKMLLTSCLLIGLLSGCGSGGNGGGAPIRPTITSIVVSCSPTSINTNQTSTCTSRVSGTGNYSFGVTWTATGGKITTGGVFTPSTTAIATITATSTQDSTKSGSASVTVTASPSIASVTVSCSQKTVPEGKSSQCTAMTQGTGDFDPTVTWKSSLGTIASTGKDTATYTAPSGTTGSATVTATSSADATQSGSTTLTVTLPPPSASFQTTAPGGGDIIAFAKDPTSPKTMYASIVDSGIYKSSDGGATWQDFGGNFPPLPSEHPPRNLDWGLIFQIAVSAQSGSVYVKYYGSASASGGQVYKTSDGGNTWNQLTVLPAPSTNLVTQITLDPLNDSNLYISDSSGAVYRSQDTGSTWSSVTLPATCGSSIYSDAVTNGTLYYASTCSGLYVSNNFGGSWSALSQTNGLRFIGQAKNNPNRIYATKVEAGPLSDLYVSSNRGGTWTEIADGYGLGGIVIDPSNADHAYMLAWDLLGLPTSPSGPNSWSASGLIETKDGGKSWDQLSQPPLNPAFATYNENMELVGSLSLLSTLPDILIAQVSDHLWSITQSGTVWAESDKGLMGNWVTQIAIDPALPTTIYTAAGNFAGTSKSSDGGRTWKSIYDATSQAIAVDPFDSRHILADDDGLYVSRDGGSTWTASSLSSAQIAEPSTIVFDPQTRGIIYAGCFLPGGGIAKSVDGGRTWSTINNGLTTASSQKVWSLIIDPFDSQVLVAGTDAGIYRSSDGGADWTLQDATLVSYSLASDPNHQGYLYAGGSTGLRKSTDDGNTWTQVNVSGPAWYGALTVAVDPKSADTIFIVPTQGPAVGWSPDGGISWFWLSNGLGQFFLGSTFGAGPVIAGTSPETLYIPSPNVGVVSLVLQH